MSRGADSSFSSHRFSVGQKVEIAGEPGIFLVIRIDRKRHCADLMLMGHNARMEYGIHLSTVQPVNEAPDPSHFSSNRFMEMQTAEGDD